MSFKIVVLAKQVPDTANVTQDAMKEDGTVNRAVLPVIFNPEMQINSMQLIAGWWKNIQNFLALKSQYASFVGLQMMSADYENFLIKALLLSQENNYSISFTVTFKNSKAKS